MPAWKKAVVHSIKPLTFGLFLLIVFQISSSRAQNRASALSPIGAHPKGLSDSTRRVVYDSQAFFGESVPSPRWVSGYLVSYEVETYKAGATNIRLFDVSGGKAREAAVWFPESERVLIYSVVPSLDGEIIAGGIAEKVDGRAGPFIALIDRTGKMTEVIQTEGFAPSNMCVAPDGTIWSFGGTGYEGKSGPRPGDTLRHFDFRKGQIGSYLPRSAFARRPSPDMPAFIHCSAQGVQVYSTQTAKYIEMNYSDDAPRVYSAPSGPMAHGFAVTGPKQVYGYFHRGGLYYLSFNEPEKTVTWLLVPGTVGPHPKPGVITRLRGADGEQLLVSLAEDGAGDTAIHWVTPLE